MVVLLSDGSQNAADDILEHYTLMGGPGGEAFTLARMTRDQLQAPKFLSLLDEAGILYLGGENPLPLVRNLYNTRTLERILEGFTTLQGLVIIGAGGGAVALGARAVGPAPQFQHTLGLSFLMNTVIVPHFTRTEDSPVLQHLSQIGPSILGLGIPDGTALAFGPQGQVETWGTGQVTAVVKAGE
jgi:cyanophycinase-like exopeptidase